MEKISRGVTNKINKLDFFHGSWCFGQALIRLVDELADAKVAGRVSLYCRL
jgi:hypothetical protein